MTREQITQALGSATGTRDVLLGSGVLASSGPLVAERFGPGCVALPVADTATFEAAGPATVASLEAAGCRVAEPLVFGEAHVRADYVNVERLVQHFLHRPGVLVAIGSGTINDLVKLAAHEAGRGPYVTVATAASVDGYASSGASITRDGVKRSIDCPAPTSVIADLDVLIGAPSSLTASGYGDLAGKVTAGADWMLADALGVEPIHARAWELVQGPLRAALAHPERLRSGDPDAVEDLMEGLVMSGIAMQAYGGSRPSSGAEHQLSHLWEMDGLGADLRPPLLHGSKVGVGTVAIAALYERLLERDLDKLDIDSVCASQPSLLAAQERARGLHSAGWLADAAAIEVAAKHVEPAVLASRLEILRRRWPELRDRLRHQLEPAKEILHRLQAVGCPALPAEIGIDAATLRSSYVRAQTIRRRYTVLDLAVDTGVFEPCLDELFSRGGLYG